MVLLKFEKPEAGNVRVGFSAVSRHCSSSGSGGCVSIAVESGRRLRGPGPLTFTVDSRFAVRVESVAQSSHDYLVTTGLVLSSNIEESRRRRHLQNISPGQWTL